MTVNAKLNHHLETKPRSKIFVANERDYLLVVKIDAQEPTAAYAMFRRIQGSISADIQKVEDALALDGIDLWSFNTNSTFQSLSETNWPADVIKRAKKYVDANELMTTVTVTSLRYT